MDYLTGERGRGRRGGGEGEGEERGRGRRGGGEGEGEGKEKERDGTVIHFLEFFLTGISEQKLANESAYTCTRGSSLCFGKVTALGVLCCFALSFV